MKFGEAVLQNIDVRFNSLDWDFISEDTEDNQVGKNQTLWLDCTLFRKLDGALNMLVNVNTYGS